MKIWMFVCMCVYAYLNACVMICNSTLFIFIEFNMTNYTTFLFMNASINIHIRECMLKECPTKKYSILLTRASILHTNFMHYSVLSYRAIYSILLF